jgi:ankyrin repeat protein
MKERRLSVDDDGDGGTSSSKKLLKTTSSKGRVGSAKKKSLGSARSRQKDVANKDDSDLENIEGAEPVEEVVIDEDPAEVKARKAIEFGKQLFVLVRKADRNGEADEVLDMVIDQKPPPATYTYKGKETGYVSPMQLAARNYRPDILQIFVDAGADLMDVDQMKRTVLMQICSFKRLASYPTTQRSRDQETYRIESVRALLSNPDVRHLNQVDVDGMNALVLASVSDFKQGVKVILAASMAFAAAHSQAGSRPATTSPPLSKLGSKSPTKRAIKVESRRHSRMMHSQKASTEITMLSRSQSNSRRQLTSLSSRQPSKQLLGASSTNRLPSPTGTGSRLGSPNSPIGAILDLPSVSSSRPATSQAQTIMQMSTLNSESGAADAWMGDMVDRRVVSKYPYRGRPTYRKQHGDTALILAARRGYFDVVRCLVEFGAANVSLSGMDSMTPLMWAVWRNDVEMVRFLILEGSDLNHVNDTGHTALMMALEKKFYYIVNILLHWGYREEPDYEDYWPEAAFGRPASTASPRSPRTRGRTSEGGEGFEGVEGVEVGVGSRKLSSQGSQFPGNQSPGSRPKSGMSASASRPGTSQEGELFPIIITEGSVPLNFDFEVDEADRCDVRIYSHHYTSPVEFLCRVVITDDPTEMAIAVEILRTMIRRGASVNIRSNDGFTPLMWSAMNSSHDLAKELLIAGADPSVPDLSGKIAAEMVKEDDMKMKLMLLV